MGYISQSCSQLEEWSLFLRVVAKSSVLGFLIRCAEFCDIVTNLNQELEQADGYWKKEFPLQDSEINSAFKTLLGHLSSGGLCPEALQSRLL